MTRPGAVEGILVPAYEMKELVGGRRARGQRGGSQLRGRPHFELTSRDLENDPTAGGS